MKTNLTAEALPVQLPLIKAANEDVHRAATTVQQQTPAAWDPYDVWRTRILPYQRQLRALADSSASG